MLPDDLDPEDEPVFRPATVDWCALEKEEEDDQNRKSQRLKFHGWYVLAHP